MLHDDRRTAFALHANVTEWPSTPWRNRAENVARRVRRNPPDQIEVIRDDLPASDRTVYDGLPSATVERALRDCIGTVMPDRLVDAADRARAEGLLRRRDHARIIEAIGAAH